MTDKPVAPESTPTPQADERAKFEAHWKGQGVQESWFRIKPGVTNYTDHLMQQRWLGWLARANSDPAPMPQADEREQALAYMRKHTSLTTDSSDRAMIFIQGWLARANSDAQPAMPQLSFNIDSDNGVEWEVNIWLILPPHVAPKVKDFNKELLGWLPCESRDEAEKAVIRLTELWAKCVAAPLTIDRTPQPNLDQLAIDLARELYDRFVMGGWEPQDAHQQVKESLIARIYNPPMMGLAQETIDAILATTCPLCAPDFCQQEPLCQSCQLRQNALKKWSQALGAIDRTDAAAKQGF